MVSLKMEHILSCKEWFIIFTFDEKDIIIEKISRKDYFSMDSYHSHPAFEIYYLKEIRGNANIIINGKRYPLKKNHVVIIDSLIPHKTDFSKAEKHTRMLIEISPTVFDKKIEDYFDISINKFFHSFTGVHMFPDSTLKKIRTCMDDINDEYLYQKESNNKLILLHLLEIIITIQRDSYMTLNKSSVYLKQNFLLEPIIRYINENMLLDIHLSDISKKFHIDKSYLSRLFKEHTNHTVHEYIKLKRVSYAQRLLLLNQKASIADIAISCGFQNVNSFIRAFKKFTDLTPFQYRKKYK